MLLDLISLFNTIERNIKFLFFFYANGKIHCSHIIGLQFETLGQYLSVSLLFILRYVKKTKNPKVLIKALSTNKHDATVHLQLILTC